MYSSTKKPLMKPPMAGASHVSKRNAYLYGVVQAALIATPLSAPVQVAHAQQSTAVQLDKIVVSAGQREQEAIDALDNVVGLDRQDIDRTNSADPSRLL